MRSTRRVSIVLGVAAATALTLAAPISASAEGSTTYRATLNQINNSGGSGSFTLVLNGNEATITEHWSGMAAKFKDGAFPHVQHIHIGGKGECPTPSADTSGDGAISTPEGQASYGGIGATLSVTGDTSPKAATNIKIAPSGASTDYSRTITLDAKTVASLKDDNAVVVVHGVDPAKLPKKAQGEKSSLVPSLPLAATAPALCGAVHSSAAGGPGTGTGSTAGVEDRGLIAVGGGLLAVAGALWLRRRRSVTTTR